MHSFIEQGISRVVLGLEGNWRHFTGRVSRCYGRRWAQEDETQHFMSAEILLLYPCSKRLARFGASVVPWPPVTYAAGVMPLHVMPKSRNYSAFPSTLLSSLPDVRPNSPNIKEHWVIKGSNRTTTAVLRRVVELRQTCLPKSSRT